jgi:hypothetical protein
VYLLEHRRARVLHETRHSLPIRHHPYLAALVAKRVYNVQFGLDPVGAKWENEIYGCASLEIKGSKYDKSVPNLHHRRPPFVNFEVFRAVAQIIQPLSRQTQPKEYNARANTQYKEV